MLSSVRRNPFEQFNLSLGKLNESKPVANDNKKNNSNTKLKAALGATIGTILPIAFMMKKSNIKNPLKLDYGLKDMLVLSSSSIIFATIGGSINENKESQQKKIKEGTFQFLNALFPAMFVASSLTLCENNSKLNSVPCKILMLGLGIISGMFSALKLSNFIFDPKDEHPDRKFSPKDCVASADDAIGALTLAKLPIVTSLNIDKALPLIYGYCGYRAGNAK